MWALLFAIWRTLKVYWFIEKYVVEARSLYITSSHPFFGVIRTISSYSVANLVLIVQFRHFSVG